MLRTCVARACARTKQITLRLAVATIFVAGLAATSHAALMGSYSLRLDGFVKSGGNTGEEGHFNASIPYINPVTPPHELPANVDPPSPLLSANDLRVTETEAANKIIISITNPDSQSLNKIFANPLDPSIPVEWEAIFSWDLGAMDKIAITDLDFVQGDETSPAFPTFQTSGRGTVADPLRVFAQIDPSDFNTNGGIVGPLKIRMDYMQMEIPEPASVALGMLGLFGLAGLVRRRR
jgi:PEP-CTERM motif